MAKWKGLILAGGTGSRLWPLTRAVNKHLLPVHDKPMIYYPLSTLMLGGIREFVIMSAPDGVGPIRELLGDGDDWGISIEYAVQERPGGIAEGFLVAGDMLSNSNIALILGDNIFYGSGVGQQIAQLRAANNGATIFAYQVSDPSQFGVVQFDDRGKPVALVEKPSEPVSRYAVPGLYLYDAQVLEFARTLKPSARGELEITDINRAYLEAGRLNVSAFGRGVAWLDGGTPGDLFEASQFVKVMEDRTGLKIACPEEVAWRMGFIDEAQLRVCAKGKLSPDYGAYLQSLLDPRPQLPRQ